MLRLTLLLCAGMYAALMIAGEDRGQMRPGLEAAAAKQAAPAVESTTVAAAKPIVVAAPVAKPAETTVALAKPAAAPAPADPEPYVEPERNVVTAVEEPVFSLSSVGNESPPAAAATPQPEVADGGQGTIWYVNASSVNVRAEPSTESEIVGRLGSGEATLMVQAVDDDWARIVIQGDGVEGFVAMRYLSAEAP